MIYLGIHQYKNFSNKTLSYKDLGSNVTFYINNKVYLDVFCTDKGYKSSITY